MYKKVFYILGIIFLTLVIINGFIIMFDESQKENLNNEVNVLKTEIQELNDLKEKLKKEIEILEIDFKNKFKEAKEYSAGQFFVGVDIPAGRYKIHDGSSNFFVYDDDGNLVVNIILGDKEEYGHINEYVYTLLDGYVIKSNSKFKLTGMN